MERMITFQLKIPVELQEALRTRAKELNLRVTDVARWALAREVGEPTLAAKNGLRGVIAVLVRAGNDPDEMFRDVLVTEQETKRPSWNWDETRRQAVRLAKEVRKKRARLDGEGRTSHQERLAKETRNPGTLGVT